MDPEEQREVAVDAFLLQLLGGFDSGPRGGDLDEDALPGDAGTFILFDNGPRLLHRLLRVERQPRVDLGGNAPGNDLEDLFAERDGQVLEGQLRHLVVGGIVAELLLGIQQHIVHDFAVGRHLRRGGQQRRVGRRILRLRLFDRFDVAGIGHHSRHRPELRQQCLRHHSSCLLFDYPAFRP